jgi:hypothetical protein
MSSIHTKKLKEIISSMNIKRMAISTANIVKKLTIREDTGNNLGYTDGTSIVVSNVDNLMKMTSDLSEEGILKFQTKLEKIVAYINAIILHEIAHSTEYIVDVIARRIYNNEVLNYIDKLGIRNENEFDKNKEKISDFFIDTFKKQYSPNNDELKEFEHTIRTTMLPMEYNFNQRHYINEMQNILIDIYIENDVINLFKNPNDKIEYNKLIKSLRLDVMYLDAIKNKNEFPETYCIQTYVDPRFENHNIIKQARKDNKKFQALLEIPITNSKFKKEEILLKTRLNQNETFKVKHILDEIKASINEISGYEKNIDNYIKKNRNFNIDMYQEYKKKAGVDSNRVSNLIYIYSDVMMHLNEEFQKEMEKNGKKQKARVNVIEGPPPPGQGQCNMPPMASNPDEEVEITMYTEPGENLEDEGQSSLDDFDIVNPEDIPKDQNNQNQDNQDQDGQSQDNQNKDDQSQDGQDKDDQSQDGQKGQEQDEQNENSKSASKSKEDNSNGNKNSDNKHSNENSSGEAQGSMSPSNSSNDKKYTEDEMKEALDSLADNISKNDDGSEKSFEDKLKDNGHQKDVSDKGNEIVEKEIEEVIKEGNKEINNEKFGEDVNVSDVDKETLKNLNKPHSSNPPMEKRLEKNRLKLYQEFKDHILWGELEERIENLKANLHEYKIYNEDGFGSDADFEEQYLGGSAAVTFTEVKGQLEAVISCIIDNSGSTSSSFGGYQIIDYEAVIGMIMIELFEDIHGVDVTLTTFAGNGMNVLYDTTLNEKKDETWKTTLLRLSASQGTPLYNTMLQNIMYLKEQNPDRNILMFANTDGEDWNMPVDKSVIGTLCKGSYLLQIGNGTNQDLKDIFQDDLFLVKENGKNPKHEAFMAIFGIIEDIEQKLDKMMILGPANENDSPDIITSGKGTKEILDDIFQR